MGLQSVDTAVGLQSVDGSAIRRWVCNPLMGLQSVDGSAIRVDGSAIRRWVCNL
ncbi:hypothetical protein DPMN_065160 [Dreissena polymorpha]|uniref:Uncharacterized protein n=1 Tax=Dreissena polymorpha TaxID=45954 RepID=A0A9D4CEU7_DREPO|nr:hypothetical protein DPMN_065160 [Dreissena polymorpha]